MTLILFDIDGTLTVTSEIDNHCYASAFRRVFGLDLPTTDWSAYEHVTDHGILEQAVPALRGTRPEGRELDQFGEAYHESLVLAHRKTPGAFQAVPGAAEIVAELSQHTRYGIALATGGLKRNALFKLACAGIDVTGIPAAFADDALSRADIVRSAVTRSAGMWNEAAYVGDGQWDVRTARALGMGFVGIAHEKTPAVLIEEGAEHVLVNFLDVDAFFNAIEEAARPWLG
ncbi:MAG: HAD hydrolase-like protein [Candidatus Hydrogenedentes bacterium]|nr:HAD hydrolase-like protein [Candidatus Hydrogenedentota bacterium]